MKSESCSGGKRPTAAAHLVQSPYHSGQAAQGWVLSVCKDGNPTVSSGLCSSAWTPQREKYLFLTPSQKFKHFRLSPICSLLSYQHPSIWLPLFCVLPWGTADTAGISPRAISPPAARRRARLPSSILAGHHSLVSSVNQLEDRCSARDTLLSNGRLYISLQGDSTLDTVVTSFSPYLPFPQVFPVFSYSLSPFKQKQPKCSKSFN